MKLDLCPENSTRVNPYSAATEKAVAAQRHLQVRKKPMKHAAGAQAGSGKAFTLDQWMSGARSRTPAETPRQGGAPGKEPKSS